MMATFPGSYSSELLFSNTDTWVLNPVDVPQLRSKTTANNSLSGEVNSPATSF